MCDLIHCCEMVGRNTTAGNLQWNTIMKNFGVQWQALVSKKKDNEEPETLKITKSLNVMKWSESFQDYLHRCIGAQTILLTYVICEVCSTPCFIPTLSWQDSPTQEAGSIEEELIQCISHGMPGTGMIMYWFTTRWRKPLMAPSYYASIRPFSNKPKMRAMPMSQCAGDDKVNTEIAKHNSLLCSQKWKGSGSFTLEWYCNNH